jgi:hypothetical protein
LFKLTTDQKTGDYVFIKKKWEQEALSVRMIFFLFCA